MRDAANRETWLGDLVDELRPEFSARGYDLPPAIRIACGWPSKRATSKSNQRIGECWRASCAADGATEIFISPALAEPLRVADIVVHELIHAALPEAGHKGPFKRAMAQLGLGGKATATVATPELLLWLAPIVEACGAYPHAALTPGSNHSKQSTRLIKVACPACKYTARITQKWIDVGLPTCPCGEIMLDCV